MDPHDARRWRAATGAAPDATPPPLHVRYYYPVPEVMLPRYEAWVAEWSSKVDDRGVPLFNSGMHELVARTKADIKDWFYSGALGCSCC